MARIGNPIQLLSRPRLFAGFSQVCLTLLLLGLLQSGLCQRCDAQEMPEPGTPDDRLSLQDDITTPDSIEPYAEHLFGESTLTTIQTPSAPNDPLLIESGSTRVKFSLDAVFQQSGVTGSWWNLSEKFAPDAGYKLDRGWAETWIKPGVRIDTAMSDELSLYAGVSYVGSGNIGQDVFEQGYRGYWGVEDAYIGTRFQLPDEESTLDVSYGRQPYKIGSGMLIAVGAMNGFERGATTTFARRAWEEAGIVKWTRGTVSLDGFYLNPNELRSGDTVKY